MAGKKQFDPDVAVADAQRVFWTYGYPETSLDRLTAATGLSKGSLYGTFGSKDGLFLRALELYAQTWGERYDQALARHAGDPARAVDAFFGVVLDRLADPAYPDGCLLCQSITDSAALEEDGRRLAHELLAKQDARLRKVLSTTGLPGKAAAELARFVMTMQQGIVVMHYAGMPIRQLRATAKVAVDAVANRLAEAGVGATTIDA
jgi:AcrR family transcriptional regulator